MKVRFSTATMLMKIIYINIGVFVVMRLIALGGFLYNVDSSVINNYIELPSTLSVLICQPWSVVTYMFAQFDILHILFNMLWLYWFGIMFLTFYNSKRMSGLYLLGGIGGAAFYIAAYNIFPYFESQPSYLLGASASVIAIVVATAMRAPDYKVNLLFLGAVSLKWIAIVTIFIDVISVDSANAGGHISHLGGALAGFLFAIADRSGIDITKWINSAIDSVVMLFRHKPKVGKPIGGKKYHYSKPKEGKPNSTTKMNADDEAILDSILDKIKQSGYASLTAEEKRRLFEVSGKNR